MNGVIFAIVIILILVLQSTIVPMIAINGIKPDIVTIFVISSGLLLGREQGVVIGFFSGLLQDLLSGNIFGLNTLSKLITGYTFGLAERRVFKEHVLLPVVTTGVGTFFNGIICIALIIILGYKIDFAQSVVYKLLPLVLYNMVLSLPIHRCIYQLSKLKY